MNTAFWVARRPWWVAGGLAIALIAAFTAWLFREKSGVNIAVILGFGVALASLYVAIVGLRARTPIGQTARQLAHRVASERGRARRQALGMSGDARPADAAFRLPSREEEPELVRWRSDGGPESGTLRDVASFYRQLARGRLVVLGEPGAGKTVLATQLVLDLIERLPDGELQPGKRPPVALWLSLTSFDLGDADALDSASAEELEASLDQWIAAQMTAVYQIHPAAARQLLHGHWVVPVLDGLDEMDPAGEPGSVEPDRPRAAAVVRALNAGTGRRPVVLVCRRGEYRQLARSSGSGTGEPVLLDATQIVLQPLTPPVISEFLARRFPGDSPGHVRQRWQPVQAALFAPLAPGHHGPRLAELLSSPWRLFLATMAYDDEDTDPTSLTQLPAEYAPRILMEQLIPAAARLTPGGERYPPGYVRDWLVTCARHLQETSQDPRLRWSPADLRLERLWPIAGARIGRLVSLITIPALICTLFVASELFRGGTGPWLTHAVWVLASVIFVSLTGNFLLVDRIPVVQRLDLASLKSSAGRRRLIRAFPLGMIGGVAAVGGVLLASLSSGQNPDWTPALAIALAFGTVAWLGFGLAGTFTVASRPTSIMRQNFTFALSAGLAIALALEVTVGPAVGWATGLVPYWALFLMFGLTVSGFLGLANWIRYTISCWIARRKGLLPPRVGRFLDWAYRANLLRMSGTAAQFRHRELQDWLYSPAPATFDAPPDSGKVQQQAPV